MECEPLGVYRSLSEHCEASGAAFPHRGIRPLPSISRTKAGFGYGLELTGATAGGVQAPLTTCSSGQNIRRARLKPEPAAGAGSQLLSLLAPGESCWM